jgi:hypothetical protein
VERIRGARLELRDEMQIEGARVVVLGVDEQPSAADRLVEGHETRNDIGQEAGAEATSFVTFVDAEAGEQCDRLWIPTCPAANARRRVRDGHLSHAPRVVRDDVVIAVSGDDKDLGRSGRRGLTGVSA